MPYYSYQGGQHLKVKIQSQDPGQTNGRCTFDQGVEGDDDPEKTVRNLLKLKPIPERNRSSKTGGMRKNPGMRKSLPHRTLKKDRRVLVHHDVEEGQLLQRIPIALSSLPERLEKVKLRMRMRIFWSRTWIWKRK